MLCSSIWMVQGRDNRRNNSHWALILDVGTCNLSRMIGLNADVTFLAMTCYHSFVRFHRHCDTAKGIFFDQRRANWETERKENEKVMRRQQTKALRRYCYLPSTDSDSFTNNHSETD